MIRAGPGARFYSGQFSETGRWLTLANQTGQIVLVSMESKCRVRKQIEARDLRWTITSTDTTPDEQFLIYSTISEVVHLCNLEGERELHEELPLGDDGFGVWCCKFSAGGQELVAGCSNSCITVFDVERKRTVVSQPAHEDDINAVAFVDRAFSPHLIVSGSDDHLVKLWDRRMMRSDGSARAAGVLPGHLAGITSLDSRGDGYYVLSNAKDQTAKLWDLRRAYSGTDFAALPDYESPFPYDYRWMEWPGWGVPTKHPHDCSAMTYRGHRVVRTLIRAYFSPSATTGSRFIYSGSADGDLHIWDALTGEQVAELEGHHSIVRDVSWHPTRPLIASASWDGTVRFWGPEIRDPERREDMLRRRQEGGGSDDEEDPEFDPLDGDYEEDDDEEDDDEEEDDELEEGGEAGEERPRERDDDGSDHDSESDEGGGRSENRSRPSVEGDLRRPSTKRRRGEGE